MGCQGVLSAFWGEQFYNIGSIALHCTRSIALHYTRSIAPHYTRSIAVHCTALHCIALHWWWVPAGGSGIGC
jgi:hypothetical protein